VLQLISEMPGADMQGPPLTPMARWRLNCFGRTLLEAGDIAKLVVDAVHGYKGMAGTFQLRLHFRKHIK